MTTGEFRLQVDRHARHLRYARERVREFSATFGYAERTVLSWYYGERPIPDYLSVALGRHKLPNVQLNAAMNLIGAELARLEEHVEAVRRFCLECEPDGLCREKACALRAVSPLRFTTRAIA